MVVPPCRGLNPEWSGTLMNAKTIRCAGGWTVEYQTWVFDLRQGRRLAPNWYGLFATRAAAEAWIARQGRGTQ
jgi:hypothetical protein